MKMNNIKIETDNYHKTVSIYFAYFRETGVYEFKNRKEYREIIKKLKQVLRYDIKKKAGIK